MLARFRASSFPGLPSIPAAARCQRGTAKQRCDLVHLTEGASGSAWRRARGLNRAASRGCRRLMAAGVAASFFFSPWRAAALAFADYY
jgi:hypothetical protein